MLMDSQRIPRVFSLIAPEAMAQIRKQIGSDGAATALLPGHNPATTATAYFACFAPFAIGRGHGISYAAWNCSASVEPDRATVSAFGEIAEVTRSK